jgi:hypothetical protein
MRLKALAFTTLSELFEHVEESSRTEVGSVSVRGLCCSVSVGPQSEVDTCTCVGRFLSDIETAIVTAIGSGCLQGKEIAAKLSRKYDPALKIIIKNLHDRGVLTHQSGEGYRKAGPTADGAGTA